MTTNRVPFKDYTPRTHGKRNLEEATSEIQREMDVRKRLFDRWVAEGKMSWMDAHDRMERHLSALKFLLEHARILEEADTSEQPLTTSPLSFPAQNELDEPASAIA